MFSLNNKVAVITGGGSGLGLATVKRFVKAGAKVVIADIADCASIADELGCLAVTADVTDEAQVEQLMKTAVESYGQLDVVINNAGTIMEEQMIDDAQTVDYKKLFNVNVLGVVYGMKHGARHMKDGGAIINTASNAANGDFAGYGAYISSKAAVVGLTKSGAIEYAPRNIRVNCICPNTIDTPMAYVEGCETERQVVGVITPLGRMCKAEEGAALLHFLAADDCRYITGEDIYIDGGLKAGPAIGMVNAVLKSLDKQE